MGEELNISNITTLAIDGTGVFDKLMATVKLHIQEEYNEGRLKGAEYAKVYLGIVQTVLTESINVPNKLKNLNLLDANIKKVEQDTKNAELLSVQINAQTNEVDARTHKLVADTYVNHGLFTGYTVTSQGISSATKVDIGYVTLSDMNKQVAKEQAKGYVWNAWSNSASSSAGMIGTLVASELPEVVDDAQDGIDNWKVAVQKLSSLEAPDINI